MKLFEPILEIRAYTTLPFEEMDNVKTFNGRCVLEYSRQIRNTRCQKLSGRMGGQID